MAKQTAAHKAVRRNEKNEVIYVCGVCTNEYKTRVSFYKHRSIAGHGVKRSKQITDVPLLDNAFFSDQVTVYEPPLSTIESDSTFPTAPFTLKRKVIDDINNGVSSEETGELPPLAPPPAKKRNGESGVENGELSNGEIDNAAPSNGELDKAANDLRIGNELDYDTKRIVALSTTLAFRRVHDALKMTFADIHHEMLPLYAEDIHERNPAAELWEILYPILASARNAVQKHSFIAIDTLAFDLNRYN